jgi:hypothetical protein
VIEKARSKEESLPSARLFKTELDTISNLFGEYCETFALSNDEYVYEGGFSEMRERLGPRVRKFQIVGSKPTVSLTFDSFALKLRVEYQDGGFALDENKRADHLFLRLKEYLGKHQTLVVRMMSNTAITVLVVIATLLIGISVFTSPRPANVDPNAIYLDLKHGLFFLSGFALLALIIFGATRRTGYHFVYYGGSDEITSFWHRKKDDLLFGIIMALFGGILGVMGTLVAEHLKK